jgi:uncharacterized protein
MNPLTVPLTEADLDRLKLLLSRVNPAAMSRDKLDGFFCALVCGPSRKPMNAYFPYVLGQDQNDDSAGYSLVDPQELSTLLVRLWNEIAAAMLAGNSYAPRFAMDAEGTPDGHDWAIGFVQGMNLDQKDWNRLIKDKVQGIMVSPMLFLLAESASDLPDDLENLPLLTEKRIELLATIPTCLIQIFRFFHRDSGKKSIHAQVIFGFALFQKDKRYFLNRRLTRHHAFATAGGFAAFFETCGFFPWGRKMPSCSRSAS